MNRQTERQKQTKTDTCRQDRQTDMHRQIWADREGQTVGQEEKRKHTYKQTYSGGYRQINETNREVVDITKQSRRLKEAQTRESDKYREADRGRSDRQKEKGNRNRHLKTDRQKQISRIGQTEADSQAERNGKRERKRTVKIDRLGSID